MGSPAMENDAKAHISAVILDLDGTLLNTEQLTKNILKELLAKYGKVENSDKEQKRMGLPFKDSALGILDDYDLPLTFEQFSQEIIPMYHARWVLGRPTPGANRLMKHLHKHGVSFSLASNSHTKNVDLKLSVQDGWREGFTAILGGDQVKSGKPSPDIFLEAAKRMGVDPVHCLVIEDTVVGVRAGKAAGMKVVAVPSIQTESNSFSIADSVLHSLLEFQPEFWGLPPFEDWIDNTLPIEPIHLSGVFSNGLFQAHADDGPPLLPDQSWGIYIGWVKFDEQRVLKTVVSLGWSLGDGNPKRNIQVCIIDESYANKYDAKMQLVLVGYLRRSYSVGNMLHTPEILDEDKSIAEFALNLPAFSQKLCKSFSLQDAGDDLVVE